MELKVVKRWVPLIVLALMMAVAFATGLHEQISLQALQEHKGAMLHAVTRHPVMTAFAFMAIYIIFVALSFPAATLLTLTGGFLFGPWLGTLYVVTAATIGAMIIFFIAKTSLGQTLREKAGGLYQRIEGNMHENATGYLLFMRLVPIFPFFLVNIVPALFNVKLRTYILTTFFGIIPGSFVYVNLGGQLADIKSLNDLVSVKILLAFALLGVFALIPTFYKQIRAKKKSLLITITTMILSTTQVQAEEQHHAFLELYDQLLMKHIYPVTTHKSRIDYNGVNYDRWSADARYHKAKQLLLKMNPVQFSSRDEKMAFWINTYNFLTIDLIVRKNEHETIKNLGGLFSSPWTEHNWVLGGGKDYTLDDIEHKILRPMGDARIHFAINCASISCPDLRMEAYRAAKLDQQLDEQVALTLASKSKGLRIERDTLYVSRIFDWFRKDFEGGDIKAWLGRYREINNGISINYMDYDWSLNKVN